MTKRVISLFLVCILAIPIFAVPVSASSSTTVTVDTDQWSDVKDLLDSLNDLKTYYLYYIKANVSEIQGYTYRILNSLPIQVTRIVDSLDSLDSSVSGYFTSLGESLGNSIDDVATQLVFIYDLLYDEIYQYLVDIYYDCEELVIAVRDSIQYAVISIDNKITSVVEKLDSLVSGGNSNISDSEDFKSDVNDADNELEEAGKVIDSATLPTISEDFDSDISDNIVKANRYFTLIKNLFSGSSLLGTILLMSFTLSTVSYVFFGKRG